MNKRFLLVLLAVSIASLCLSACASGNVPPLPDTLSVQRNIFTVNNRLNEIARSGKLALKQTGVIKYGQFETATYALTFSPPGKIRRLVLLAGCVHGNEPAGLETLLQTAEQIAREPQKYEGYYFDIIPLVNPWGWVYDARYNRDGIDINRDFATLASQEARLIQHSTSGKAYDLVIDFHEDPGAQGFYLYQNAAPDTVLGRKVITAIRDAGYPIEQNVSMVVLKVDDGLIDAPMWSLLYMQATQQLSCPSYFRLDRNSTSFTIETPKNLPWEDRVKMNRMALREILSGLGAADTNAPGK